MEQKLDRAEPINSFAPGDIVVFIGQMIPSWLYAETSSDSSGRHLNSTVALQTHDVATIISVREGFVNDMKLFVLLSRTGSTGWTWSSNWLIV